MRYLAILFEGPELVLVGWLDGVDVVEHNDPWHPIGVLLGTCLVSMQAMATCWCYWLQGSSGCVGSGIVMLAAVGTLDETRNSSMGPPWRIDPTTHCTMNRWSTIIPWSYNSFPQTPWGPVLVNFNCFLIVISSAMNAIRLVDRK